MGGIIQVNIQIEQHYKQVIWDMYKVGLVCTIEAKSEDGSGNFILATLPEQSQKFLLTGKVVWISHKQSGFKPQGFAIQLSGDKEFTIKLKLSGF